MCSSSCAPGFASFFPFCAPGFSSFFSFSSRVDSRAGVRTTFGAGCCCELRFSKTQTCWRMSSCRWFRFGWACRVCCCLRACPPCAGTGGGGGGSGAIGRSGGGGGGGGGGRGSAAPAPLPLPLSPSALLPVLWLACLLAVSSSSCCLRCSCRSLLCRCWRRGLLLRERRGLLLRERLLRGLLLRECLLLGLLLRECLLRRPSSRSCRPRPGLGGLDPRSLWPEPRGGELLRRPRRMASASAQALCRSGSSVAIRWTHSEASPAVRASWRAGVCSAGRGTC